MARMIRHISVSIDMVLGFSDKQLGEIFEGDGTQIREELLERKTNGEIKIGSENCEGFDPVKGCPGRLLSRGVIQAVVGMNMAVTLHLCPK